MHRIFLIYLNKEKIVEEKNIKDNIAEKLKKKLVFDLSIKEIIKEKFKLLDCSILLRMEGRTRILASFQDLITEKIKESIFFYLG